MERYIDQFFAFIDSIKGTKEAGIVEIVVGLIIVIICAIFYNKKKK